MMILYNLLKIICVLKVRLFILILKIKILQKFKKEMTINTDKYFFGKKNKTNYWAYKSNCT